MNTQVMFSPISMGALELANRIVMAPMTRSHSPGGIPGQNVVDYYQARADAGLIITEGTTVNHPGSNGYPNVPHFYGDQALTAWGHVATAVHRQGGKIFPQLWHVGQVRRLGMEPDPKVPAYGPMAKEKDGTTMVKAMTQQDIDDVIKAFADAAAAAQDLGFDGVEVHGAHGYLIDQFFYEGTNQRQDVYGGSLENRCRFGKEVIEAIRKRVGPSFPICLRFSQWKMTAYDAKLAETPEDLKRFLDILVAAGVDIFHCSTRRFWEPEFAGSPLNLAGWTKELTGKPVITVGSVGLDQDFLTTFNPKFAGDTKLASLDRVTEGLQQGDFDLVAVGRGFISNPDWVKKVKEGRLDQLVPYSKDHLVSLA